MGSPVSVDPQQLFDACRDHFPNYAIVPGYVIAELGYRAIAQSLPPVRASLRIVARLLAPVVPQEPLQLTVFRATNSYEVDFTAEHKLKARIAIAWND